MKHRDGSGGVHTQRRMPMWLIGGAAGVVLCGLLFLMNSVAFDARAPPRHTFSTSATQTNTDTIIDQSLEQLAELERSLKLLRQQNDAARPQTSSQQIVPSNLRAELDDAAAGELPGTTKKRKFAYMFYITSDGYACAALVIMDRLRNVLHTRPDIDMVALHTKDMSSRFVDKMHQLVNARTILVDPLTSRSNNIQDENQNKFYLESLTKFRVFQEFGYDRVIYLDADATPLQNLDHLFNLPAHVAPLYAPRGYWLENPRAFTSTLLLLTPSNKLFEELVEYAHSGKEKATALYWFDMDILNFFFADKVRLLPPEYTILSDEFARPAGSKNRLYDTTSELAAYTKIIHFSPSSVGLNKPWAAGRDMSGIQKKGFHPVFQQLYETYWKMDDLLCKS